MCGRYVQASSPSLLAERFGVGEVREQARVHEPDYNVAPTRGVPIVAQSEGERVLDVVRWGLVPVWVKDLASIKKMSLINARADTVASKPAYRKAFERRRCIIPADGFYEWRRMPDRKAKQPYFIHRVDREPIAFAGIWERWKDPEDDDAEWIRSCAIITTDANELMQQVHDRMPVMLPESVFDEWLDPENHDVEKLQRLLVPAPEGDLALYPVSTRVNRPANNDASLLEEVTPESSTSGAG
jgi:putative SOS response-associated peptidase YedK